MMSRRLFWAGHGTTRSALVLVSLSKRAGSYFRRSSPSPAAKRGGAAAIGNVDLIATVFDLHAERVRVVAVRLSIRPIEC